MDVSSTTALPSYSNTLASTKTDTSAGIAMLNEANKMQADAAEQMIQSVTEATPPAPVPPEGTGRYVNEMA
ncbi:putative motility protein [Allochromatium palmeri]|uniref:Putative motility protein n=1 Tax=Allochromatium palmeri TaxID=231048 RepID=A0A6N8EBS1_9GAMM|nr:putative motility protein [Allochromatium palmeri]MTW20950.1 putative motility protein [Allochromatium palmeri]